MINSISIGQIYFAIFFVVLFMLFIVWSYRKDLKLHKYYYKGSSYIFVFILISIILLLFFKDYIKG